MFCTSFSTARRGGRGREGRGFLGGEGGGQASLVIPEGGGSRDQPRKKKTRQDTSVERNFFGGFFCHPLYKKTAENISAQRCTFPREKWVLCFALIMSSWFYPSTAAMPSMSASRVAKNGVGEELPLPPSLLWGNSPRDYLGTILIRC